MTEKQIACIEGLLIELAEDLEAAKRKKERETLKNKMDAIHDVVNVLGYDVIYDYKRMPSIIKL